MLGLLLKEDFRKAPADFDATGLKVSAKVLNKLTKGAF